MVDLHADHHGEHERDPLGGNTGENHDDGRSHRAAAFEDQGDSATTLG